jgi:hypothetical protein
MLAAHIPASGWASDARCRSLQFDDFFGDEPSPAARAACEGCPVRLDCLADEIEILPDDIHGYRAGLAVDIRRDVLRAARGLRPSTETERRRKAIIAVNGGATIRNVAEATGVSVRTIHRWIRAA